MQISVRKTSALARLHGYVRNRISDKRDYWVKYQYWHEVNGKLGIVARYSGTRVEDMLNAYVRENTLWFT